MSGTLPNEQNLLAIILAKPEHAARIFAAVPVDKFDPPMNLIAEAIQALRVNRQHIDPSTVTEELRRRGLLGRIGGNAVVFEIAQFYITDGSLDYHLSAVVENRNLRDLWKAGTRLAQNAENAQARMVSASDVANAAANDVQAVMDRVGADRDAYIESLAELMADQEGDTHDWVIPGLIERMDRLIQQILDYSRMNGTGDPPQTYQLETIVDEVIDNLRFEFPACSMQWEHPGEPVTMRGHPAAIRTACENILRNACKYAATDDPIEVNLQADAKTATVSIRDHGAGVNDSEINRLLQPFYRSGNQMHTSGFGLGLSIAEKAVLKHNGKLQLENHPEGGLRVSLTIPKDIRLPPMTSAQL